MSKKVYRDCPVPKIECSEYQWSDSCQKVTLHSMLTECEAFYYVYRWLDQETKMPVYNGNLEEYEAEVDQDIEKRMNQPHLEIPKWTNGAFAAELALKFLFVREQKSYGNIHYLGDLFRYLPKVHKTELLNRIKTQAHQTEDIIEKQLPFFSDAFVKSRYFFENKSLGVTGLFDPFVRIVCEYALEFDKEDDCEATE